MDFVFVYNFSSKVEKVEFYVNIGHYPVGSVISSNFVLLVIPYLHGSRGWLPNSFIILIY